jgi:hypothetical protein
LYKSKKVYYRFTDETQAEPQKPERTAADDSEGISISSTDKFTVNIKVNIMREKIHTAIGG